MTKNLYFGTDLTPVTHATGFDFLVAVGAAYSEAMASEIPARATAWADEIAQGQPDLVGVQEAVVWRDEAGFDFTGALDANIESANFLTLLQGALASRGL